MQAVLSSSSSSSSTGLWERKTPPGHQAHPHSHCPLSVATPGAPIEREDFELNAEVLVGVRASLKYEAKQTGTVKFLFTSQGWPLGL